MSDVTREVARVLEAREPGTKFLVTRKEVKRAARKMMAADLQRAGMSRREARRMVHGRDRAQMLAEGKQRRRAPLVRTEVRPDEGVSDERVPTGLVVAEKRLWTPS